MHHPLTVATIVALSSISHAQTAANAPPAQPQYTVDGTLIPADYFANQAPLGGAAAGPVSTAFTYQGFLENGGTPANAAFDMTFVLLDDLGNTVAGPTCIDNVAVSAGIFTVQLDFGAQFDGRARRLGIAVRPGGPVGDCANPGGYTALTPAQPITATPYALGLRLPFNGVDLFPGGSTFTITNETALGFSSASAMLGVIGARPVFPFADNAGVRGESTVGIGVLGVTTSDFGVVGFASGEGGRGVFARADGANSFAFRGIAADASSWAGFFLGRGYFSDNVGIGTQTPNAPLDVAGTTRTTNLQVTDNAGAGRILVSDAQGNATWTQYDASMSTASGVAIPFGTAFISSTTTLNVTEGQRVLVTATQSLGSTLPTGGVGLDIWVGHQPSAGGTLTAVGSGIFGLRVPQNTRIPFTLSAIVTGLPTGNYRFGMVGRTSSAGNAASWNNNEFGYVTAVTLP